MKLCEMPWYVEMASGIISTLAVLSIFIGLAYLGYYAGRGWEASRKDKKK